MIPFSAVVFALNWKRYRVLKCKFLKNLRINFLRAQLINLFP